MKIPYIYCSAALMVAAAECVAAAKMREVTVNFAVKAESAPVLDGRLDDEVWKTALVHDRFFRYWKTDFKPATVKSQLRLLYTDTALWIGLTHFEEHPEKLKVVGLVRDSINWLEDMSEIYVDPFGDAIGFTALFVNSAGVMGDYRRVDGSVVLYDWSGTAWQAKTFVGADRWTIEVCLPYSDLQQPPAPGKSLWRFCATRFSWTSGSFVGNTSSFAGSYAQPHNFGYLAFLRPGEKPGDELVIRALAGRIAAPWSVEAGGRLVYDAGDGVKVEALAEVMAAKRRELAAKVADASFAPGGALAKEFAKLKAAWDAAIAGDGGYRNYREFEDAYAEMRIFLWRAEWKVKLQKEFGGKE